jgi:hypothetical protein
MKKYEVGFVFFIESDNVAGKDALLDELDLIDEVTLRNVYNDGEDWNIECVAEIESKATKNIDEAVDKKLRKLLPNVCWDYHYIKSIDNDYYWQP